MALTQLQGPSTSAIRFQSRDELNRIAMSTKSRRSLFCWNLRGLSWIHSEVIKLKGSSSLECVSLLTLFRYLVELNAMIWYGIEIGLPCDPTLESIELWGIMDVIYGK